MSTTPSLPPDVWNALPVEVRTLFEALRLQADTLQEEIRSLQNRLDTDSRHLKRQRPKIPSGKKRRGQPGH